VSTGTIQNHVARDPVTFPPHYSDEENPAVLQDSEEIAQYLLPERADNIPVSISIHRMDHFTYLNWLDRIFAKKWLDPPQQIVIS
jgi:hypothetical protein